MVGVTPSYSLWFISGFVCDNFKLPQVSPPYLTLHHFILVVLRFKRFNFSSKKKEVVYCGKQKSFLCVFPYHQSPCLLVFKHVEPEEEETPLGRILDSSRTSGGSIF
uniref:Uncharacterized protein n=1 Tax=Cacopsylla melanoneura TaxID=428564 RepID=A0A8D8LMD1_9HEMI